jgi:hypothetical protein
MNKLIELGVASTDTRQTIIGTVFDSRVEDLGNGRCLFYKIFNSAGTGPVEGDCPV